MAGLFSRCAYSKEGLERLGGGELRRLLGLTELEAAELHPCFGLVVMTVAELFLFPAPSGRGRVTNQASSRDSYHGFMAVYVRLYDGREPLVTEFGDDQTPLICPLRRNSLCCLVLT